MINELVSIVNSGARGNKYRITIPVVEANFSRKFDFMVQSTTFPSKTITPVEVFIKGRKVQLRGETNLENTWDLTFYNTVDMKARRLLLEWMDEVHKNQWSPDSINQGPLRDVLDSIKSIGKGISNLLENPLSLFDDGVISYQKNILIEQLDNNGNVTFKTLLIGAFPVNIGRTDLADSEGNVTQSTVTFAFTDILHESPDEGIKFDDIDKFLTSF